MDFFLNETDYYSHRNYRNDLLDRNTQLGNYWIGFFLADGHLTDKGGLEFFQCTKNQPIVDKFNSYSKGTIKSTSPSMDKEGNRIYLQKSPVVAQYVKDFDVSTNMKDNPIFGKILDHIDFIKNDPRLLNAFIAGFIDGDGHITKKGKCRIELKSTWEPFLKKIKEVLGLNSNVIKRTNRDASYLDIRKSKMKELKRGQESFLGPRWERVLESFDFDSDDNYELGQPIIDRYKNIQILENLISKFVYSHYPNNNNIVTPRVVLDNFIWRFFPYYYDTDDDYIEGISRDFGDKCKMTIIHTGTNFEQYERKRINIEFPKKSTRKSFVEECSRKMAEGLVDVGIDMKHLVTEKTELSESFDFNSNDDYELGQPIIDRYKTIQTLENLISKFVYSHYPDNKNIVTPRIVLDSFMWKFFPFYYDNRYNFIDCFSYDAGDKCKMTIIHGGEDLEQHERKRIKIEFPKNNTRKSFVENCSRKMAEGLVDAGIDMKHLVPEKTDLSELTESFDFNSETDDEELGQDIIDRYKSIQFLSELIYEYADRAFSSRCTARPWPISAMSKFLDDYFQYYYTPNEANETISYSGHKDNENFNVFIELIKNDKPISKVKIEIPVVNKKEIDKTLFVKECSRKIAEGLVDAGIDINHIESSALSESFDFNSETDDEEIVLDNTVNKLKRIALLSSKINDIIYDLKERMEEFGDTSIWAEGFIDNIIFSLFSHFEDPYEAVDFGRVGSGDGYILFTSFGNDLLGKPVELRQANVHLPEVIEVNKDLSPYVRAIAKALVEIGVDEICNLCESFDFENDEEYDLGIDKISTYYKICEKELERTLENNTTFEKYPTYNIALILIDFLHQIGLEAFELFMSEVKYPKGKIHFIYDDTERCQWNTKIVGNREETKSEIKRMFSDILKDEEVLYDLSEIIKEKKLNESFDFNAEDNYEQEIDDKVSKIKKFQEWNFNNGFKILENFYSIGLNVNPNMKLYSYPSVSLLINILYPTDKLLAQGNTREVRVTISENQSRNNGTGLYFRNNKTGKISYKEFPYEYTIKEFKDKWAYLVIEALEEIGASKSTLMRNNDPLYESFDFSNDNEDSLLEKISEICLIRKIIEEFRESVEKTFKAYYVINTKELYTINAYQLYLNRIQDYIYKKSKELFDIQIYWMKNTENYAMDIKVVNGAGEKFMMRVPYKVSFEELSDVEFPKVLKDIINNMPDYKEMLVRNF